jgi:cobalt-zinc-cadmium efflux system membrane fusion protein
VRSEVKDPKHELRAQMLASFVIRTGEPSKGISVPDAGVVREGDGTMTVFVTQDGRSFKRRAVKIGLAQNGFTQIAEGLNAGEKVAADGALFLSNALALKTR